MPLPLVFTKYFTSRPVDVIATSLESIQATDLSRRIDPHAPDIEVKRLTSSINQLLDRLGTSFKTMREFTADVSHQLQTPLTVMKGTINSAQNGNDAERSKALDALSEEVNALTATLQDLRDLALADADSAEPRGGPVAVSEVFAEAGELVGALAEAHGVTCETQIEPGLRVWGNAVRLRQLMLNLGENAVEFTPAGGRVRIEAARRDGPVVAMPIGHAMVEHHADGLTLALRTVGGRAVPYRQRGEVVGFDEAVGEGHGCWMFDV